MTEQQHSCTVCGQGLHPRDPGVKCSGFVASGPVYRHGGACDAEADRRMIETDICRHCRRGFQRRPNGSSGRPAEYCDDKCRKAHERAVARVWRDAARGTIPEGLDAIVERRNQLVALVEDVKAGRYNQTAPAGVAERNLSRYSRQLAGAYEAAVKAQRDAKLQRIEAGRQAAIKDRWEQISANDDAFYAGLPEE